MITQQCRHHWIIETPNGETSNGKCKKCGLERSNFRNWVVDYYNSDLGATFSDRTREMRGRGY